MKKADLMELIGKRVHVYFKTKENDICGTLQYDYRIPTCFYINDIKFLTSQVRKVEEQV